MNSIGRLFRVMLSGESHGPGVLVTLDGVPGGMALSPVDFAEVLQRRHPQTPGTTPRREEDTVEIWSGVVDGRTTGGPVTMLVRNGDVDDESYCDVASWPRPGHADFVSGKKYFGWSDIRGGGFFSGRMTVGLVLGGVVARRILQGVSIIAELECEDGEAAWRASLLEAARTGDSVGGVVKCRVDGVPVGWGEPFFDSLESVLAHGLFSIPGVKGVEFGAGFGVARMCGSECNDVYIDEAGHTLTNNNGGISGGISNGNAIEFRVALRPTASIKRPQQSWDFKLGCLVVRSVAGRHDVCFAQRVPVVVESVVAIVLADMYALRMQECGVSTMILGGGAS